MVGRIPASGEFQDFEIRGFKGLRDAGPYELADPHYLSIAKNVMIGKNGEIIKRPGFIRRLAAGSVLANGSQINFLGSLNPNNADVHQLLITEAYGTPSSVYITNNSGATISKVSGATLAKWSPGFQYLNSIYGGSSGGIWSWDGTTFTSSTGAGFPSGTYIKSYLLQSRFFMINLNGDIRFSEPGNFGNTGWPAANFISFPGDGENVVGIITYRDRLIIFRSNSVYVLTLTGSPSTWTLKQLSFKGGCTSANACVVYNDILYFISTEGLYATDLSTFKKLSDPVENFFTGRKNYMLNRPNIPGGVLLDDGLIGFRNKLFLKMEFVGNVAEDKYINKYGLPAGAASVALGYPHIAGLLVYDLVKQTWTEWEPAIYGSDVSGGNNWVTPSYGSSMFAQEIAAGAFGFATQNIWAGLYLSSTSKLFNATNYSRIELYREGPYQNEGNPNSSVNYWPLYSDPDAGLTPGDYKAQVRTEEIDYDLPNQLKRCPFVSIRGSAGDSFMQGGHLASLNVSYYTEGALSGVTPNGFPLVATLNDEPKQTKLKGPGWFRKLELDFTETTPGKYYSLHEVVVSIRPKRKLTKSVT